MPDPAVVAFEAARAAACAPDAAAGAAAAVFSLSRGLDYEAGHAWLAMTADACCLRFEPRTLRAAVAVGRDWLAELDERILVPGLGLAGAAWRRGEPLWRSERPSWACGASAQAAGFAGGLAIPVRHGKATVAVLELYARRARPADEALRPWLARLGTLLGALLAQKTLEERERDLGERRRAAMLGTLQEDVGQSLTALALLGRGLHTVAAKGSPKELASRVAEVVDLANDATSRLRFMCAPEPRGSGRR